MIRRLSLTEFLLLAGFVFFLPLAEAPKNIFLFSFIILWFWASWRTKNYGECPAYFWAPLALIASLSFFPLINPLGVGFYRVNNIVDFISIALLAIIVSRSGFGLKERRIIIAVIFFGLIFTIVEGILRGGRFPSLKSVGHINQVAIYLAVVWGLSVAMLVTCRTRTRFAFQAAITLLISYLVMRTDSRNALFAVMLTSIFLLGLAPFVRDGFLKVLSGLVILGIAVGVGLTTSPLLTKHESAIQATGTPVDEARAKLWFGAILVAKERPWFGYGVGNFGAAHSPPHLKRIVEESGEIYSDSSFVFTDHAHNLTLNWAVERGFLAVISFYSWMAVLVFVCVRCLVIERRFTFAPVCVIITIMTALFSGLGNTSWHHEHGLLAALLIAMGMEQVFKWKIVQPPGQG